MGDRENKQELSASATSKKQFILAEIEQMHEENIGLTYAFMLGRTGKAH